MRSASIFFHDKRVIPVGDRASVPLAFEFREVWMVKLADRITNLEPPPPGWLAEKEAAYKLQAQAIHDALSEAHEGLATRMRAKIEAYPGG